MTITKAQLGDSKLGLLWRQIRPIAKKEFERLAEGKADYVFADKMYVFVEEVRRAMGEISESLDIVFKLSGGSGIVAFQRVVASADNLTTTDAANDTITTASETDYAFNWTDARRVSRIVLSPGEGVRMYGLVFDKVLADIPIYQGMMWAKSANELQRVHWDGAAWVGKEIDIGWTLDLVQWFPAMAEDLS